MDINQNQFWKELLPILTHISNAKFIAVDLEMSGIATRSRFGPNPKGHDNGKPSLQALYKETRAAAELYQVLQIGITCVEEDRDKEYYLVRPFNINLSPLLYQENRFKDRFPERKIVFSSSAIDFLQNQASFDVGKVFRDGVYYLSHADEDETRERFRLRNNRESSKSDAVTQPGDTTTLDFIRYVRKTINDWVSAEEPEYPFVNVEDPRGGDLNSYQRMLVHQLVQSDFPGYRSFARGNQSFVQVEKVNPKREAQFQAKKQVEFNDAVAKQIGVRWIFEALSGGKLSAIPSNFFAAEYAEDPELSQRAIDKKFDEIQINLENKKHVLVGHNLFTDLVCLYKTFVGPLPNNVDDFKERIHGIFPLVFDTKYIVTEGHDAMSNMMRKNLEELLGLFKKIHVPLVLLHENHISYNTGIDKSHEAGFDSYMTAQLFIKLSAQVYADRKRLENFDAAVVSESSESDHKEGSLPYHSYDLQSYHTDEGGSSLSSKDASEDNYDGGAKLSPPTSYADHHGPSDDKPVHKMASAQSYDDNLLGVSLKTSNGNLSMSMSDNFPSGWHADQLQKLNGNESNRFAVLAEVGDGIGNGIGNGADSDLERESKVKQWLPELDSSFWHLYENKLRVNASEDGICDLAEF